jgi:hypothetical protein
VQILLAVINSKDCDESSEKSKTYVGIRTEIDHKTKIVTRDQEALIVKASRKFEWDGRTTTPEGNTGRIRSTP